MSESGGYGDGDDAICGFAFDIIRHLNILKANAWVYWQVLDKVPGWALLTVSPIYPWWFSPYNYNPQRTINYYTMKQFSFHIRPGYTILKNSKSDTLDYCHICMLSAISKDSTRLVIIVLNNMSNAVNHTVDVSEAFNLKNSSSITARRTCSRTNDTYSFIDPSTIGIGFDSINIHLFAFSVTTVELF
jgi:O-glycosyl hydrolase